MNKLPGNIDGFDVAAHSFFKAATNAERASLNAQKICQKYKKGEIIFAEDSHPQGLYWINSGKIKIFKTGFDGKEQIIHWGLPGDLLGYRALLAEEAYSVSSEAIEETVACLIPSRAFINLLDNNRHLNRQLMKSICHELNLASERLTSMAQKNVRERLAEVLLHLHDTFKSEDEADALINITLPREDIANLVGTATETVIRLLSEFKEDKLVEFEGKRIRLLDKPKLRRVAEMD